MQRSSEVHYMCRRHPLVHRLNGWPSDWQGRSSESVHAPAFLCAGSACSASLSFSSHALSAVARTEPS